MSMIEINNIDEVPTSYNYEDCSVRKLESITYNSFVLNYMAVNLPCIIINLALTWESTCKWVQNDTINISYLIEKYGDIEAPVANCNDIEFNAQCKKTMKIKEYMQYLSGNRKQGLLYLKDLHLKRIQPCDMFYEVPELFASDWLNEFALDHKEDDFMFVYIGPKDSWTPLHVDVYSSYSWSANVVGRKKWTLFPPGEEDKLKDSLGNLPLLFDSKKYSNVKYIEVIQEKGEAIFVPSGWHHQVVNLLDTISINHNWINSCNIQFVWTALQKSLLSVEQEIKEYKDTPEYTNQCQLILKALFGMDLQIFVDFVLYIGKKRLCQLKEDKSNSNHFLLGKNHIMFDLMNVYKIITSIQNHPLYVGNRLLLKTDFFSIQNSISQLI